MSASLEDLIRAVIKSGDFTHLTLAPTQGGKFQAGWSGAKRNNGYSIAIEKDPIEALRAVFKPVKVKTAKPKPVEDDEDLLG